MESFFAEDITPSGMASQILKEKPDIVAFSVYIWNYNEVMECIRTIKDKNGKVVIICGGPQVSPIAREVMIQNPCIDVVPYITIPGELIFYQFIKSVIEEKELDSVQGIIYRTSEGSLVETSPLREELDYSTVPSPYFDNLFHLNSGADYVVSLEGSRGCPYDCGYCFNGRGMNKIHYFPLEKVLREIAAVYNNPDVKYVFFSDSDILLNRKRAESIINNILRQGSRVVTEFSLDILHIKLLNHPV